MRKKLIISLVLCMLLVFVFAFMVNAEESTCEHTYDKWTVTLGSEGFLGDITAETKCTTCKETIVEVIPKLFITRGYSSSDDGIAQGYGVNRESLARYEQLSGEKVKFGAVVALKNVIGNVSPLDENGNPINSQVKSRDYTDTDFSVINVAIKSIPDNVKDSIKMMCAFYINVGGRNTYLDNGAEKSVCDAKTYDEIAAVPEKDTTKLDEYKILDGKRYHQLTLDELNLVQGKYWNGSSLQSSSDAKFNNKFWTTGDYFTKETLPIGSIIMIDSENGWQYRPHKWSGTRPANTKDEVVIVDEGWWGSFTKVGFNIGKYDGEGPTQETNPMLDISGYTAEEIAEIFKIYIPATYEETDWSEPDIGGEDTETDTDTNTDTTTDTSTDTEIDTDTETDIETDTETETETEVPELPDYSAEKQGWNDDGKLKILAIGNSFSDDAMDHVYKVAYDAGITDITLGKLYIGGCSLATHLAHAKSGNRAYDYKVNTTGTWTAKGNQSIQYAVQSDDWDFITFQQVSGYSGVADTYDDLVEIIRIVEPLNPSARLAWHMTWAYQKGSGHADFPKYNKDQMTMYNAIVDAVDKKILTNDHIEIVIPSGTSIQNVRTSFIGDTVTRDGYHLSLGLGRYIAAMTYVKALTGLSIDNSVTRPDDVDSYELKAIIECVNNAITTPYAVTNSTYVTTQGGSGDDDSTNVGVIPEGYVQLTATQMGLTFASFYNTTGSDSWEATGDAFARGFMATKKFTREELPVGSIIEIAEGWQYRPEGWKFAVSRPNNVTTQRIIIDESWWGSYSERAFNISQVGHTTNNKIEITETTDVVANTIFKIIVPSEVAPDVDEPIVDPDEPTVDPTPDPEPDEPETPDDTKVYVKSSDCDSEVVTIDGKEYRALSAEAMGYIKNAYYFSQNKGAEIYESGTSGTPAKFFATKVFTQDDLPIGAVIWVNSGWQYRPEGWEYTGSRPGNVTTTYVTVDAAWWGTWTQRGFNLSKTNGATLTSSDYTAETIHENFKIYIPVENIID